MRVILTILLAVGIVAGLTVPETIDFHTYQNQLDLWKDEVQNMVLNGDFPESSNSNNAFEAFEDVDFGDDAEEEDPDMMFGDDDEDENEQLETISNLQLSSATSTGVDEAATETANEFDEFDQILSRYPTEDYIDLRVADDSHYGEKQGQGHPVFLVPTKDEIKDAVALTRRMYEPQATVQSKTADVQAEIYLKKAVRANSNMGDAYPVSNLEFGSLVDEANKDWNIVQTHFKKFSDNIAHEVQYKWRKLANWASSARSKLVNTGKQFKQWGKSIKKEAKGQWKFLLHQAQHASKAISGLLTCKVPNRKYSMSVDTSESSGVAEENTAYVVLRGNDALTDWIQTFHHSKTKCNLPGCKGDIHAGFKNTYDSIRNKLVKKIWQTAKTHNIKRIVIAGHSLGGALAVLHGVDAMSSYPTVSVGLVTFGQPKVGDQDFANFADVQLPKYSRVVAAFQKAGCNCETEERTDFVTTLPKAQLGFVHAGQQISVPCFTGDCATRCCPQNMINQVKCHALDKYVHSTWSLLE